MGLEVDKEKLAVTVAQYFGNNDVTWAAIQPLVAEARSIFIEIHPRLYERTPIDEADENEVNYSSLSDIRTMDNYLKAMEVVANLDAELKKDDVNALVYVVNEILRSNSYEEKSLRIIRLLDGMDPVFKWYRFIKLK